MASSLGSLVLELSADVARFSSDLGKAEHLAQSYARKISGIFKSVSGALGIGLGAVGIGDIFKTAIDRAREAEQASNRLSAVLKATGSSAGFAKANIDQMADALAKTTQFDDESIRNAAASLLIFKNIQGQTFTETLKLSTDVAAFFSMGLPEAAAKLGRSLEDPETAFGLLKRAGIVLTEQQKAQITTMGELGNKAGQQEVILNRLREAFGGTAEAMNTGLTQASGDLKKAWDELLESFGRTNVVKNAAEASLFSVAGALEFLKEKLDNYNESTRKTMALRGGLAGQLERLNPEPEFKDPTVKGNMHPGMRILRDREQSAAFDFEQAKKAAEAAKRNAAVFGDQAKRLALLRSGAEFGDSEFIKMKTLLAEDKALKDLAPTQKRRLLDLAAEVDVFKELQAQEKERAEGLAENAKEQSRIGNEEMQRLTQLKSTMIEMIDPLQKYRAQLEDVDKLERAGLLTQDQALEARFAINNAMEDTNQRLNGLAKDTAKVTDEMTEFWKQAARNMESSMSTFFFDVMQGNLSDLSASFKRTIDRMVADMLAAKAATALFGADFGKGGAIGGEVGGLIKLAATVFGADTQAPAPVVEGTFRAAGGPVMGGSTYLVGERGPELFTPASDGNITPNHALGGLVINGPLMVVNTPDVGGFRASKGQIAASIASALNAARRNL